MILTNVPAAVGFFILGIVATLATVALFLTRRRWSEAVMNGYLRSASQAKPGFRWIWFHWRGPKWSDERYRQRQRVGLWIPVVAATTMCAVISYGAAIAHL